MSDIDERPSKKARLEEPSGMTAQDEEIEAQFEGSPSDPADEPSKHSEAGRRARPQVELGNTEGLSKSALKKLRKKLEWDAGKDYRKEKRRDKNKEKQARKAEERAELAAKIAAGEIEPEPVVEKPKFRYPRPIQVPLTFILDCDFNELMTEKELISLGSQLTRCYSDNKVTPYRAHVAISSWGGALKERFETVLVNNQLAWRGVKFFEDDFEAAAKEMHRVMASKEGGKLAGTVAPPGIDPMTGDPFKTKEEKTAQLAASSTLPQGASGPAQDASSTNLEHTESTDVSSIPITTNESTPMATESEDILDKLESTLDASIPKLVYLSSDSPHTLERLSPNTSYIIGGIVDKNRHKGLCYKRACERGIPTAKLPIGQYLAMSSRQVLAVNHVVEIMLKWMETGDWGEAFLSVMPKRKGAKLKGESKGIKEESVDVDDEEAGEGESKGDAEENEDDENYP